MLKRRSKRALEELDKDNQVKIARLGDESKDKNATGFGPSMLTWAFRHRIHFAAIDNNEFREIFRIVAPGHVKLVHYLLLVFTNICSQHLCSFLDVLDDVLVNMRQTQMSQEQMIYDPNLSKTDTN